MKITPDLIIKPHYSCGYAPTHPKRGLFGSITECGKSTFDPTACSDGIKFVHPWLDSVCKAAHPRRVPSPNVQVDIRSCGVCSVTQFQHLSAYPSLLTWKQHIRYTSQSGLNHENYLYSFIVDNDVGVEGE